jgi:hypothetical protein
MGFIGWAAILFLIAIAFLAYHELLIWWDKRESSHAHSGRIRTSIISPTTRVPPKPQQLPRQRKGGFRPVKSSTDQTVTEGAREQKPRTPRSGKIRGIEDPSQPAVDWITGKRLR